MPKRVMIVDDALFMRSIIRGTLTGRGYEVVAEAASGIEAMKYLLDRKPEIVVLDIVLPDANGLELLDEILAARPGTNVVICSSLGQEQIVRKAMEHGARAFLQKPFTPDKVIETLQSLGD